ncbi:MAG: hypothetical protein CMH46_13715 [Muricauda sp.]|nr:hypothetical protein [Allomuricauda sp.]
MIRVPKLSKIFSPNLTQTFALGSYRVFVVFGKISVEQKTDRAQSTTCFGKSFLFSVALATLS